MRILKFACPALVICRFIITVSVQLTCLAIHSIYHEIQSWTEQLKCNCYLTVPLVIMVFNSRYFRKAPLKNEVTLTSILVYIVRVMAHPHSTPGSFTCDTRAPGVKLAKEQIPRWKTHDADGVFIWSLCIHDCSIMYLRLLTDKRPRRVMGHSVRCDITLWLVDLVSRLARCSLKGPQLQVPLYGLVPASAPSESLFTQTSWCFFWTVYWTLILHQG